MEFKDLKGMFIDVKTRMDSAIERVRRDMAHIRTGRATVSLLDGIQVWPLVHQVSVFQVAGLTVIAPYTLVPWFAVMAFGMR